MWPISHLLFLIAHPALRSLVTQAGSVNVQLINRHEARRINNRLLSNNVNRLKNDFCSILRLLFYMYPHSDSFLPNVQFQCVGVLMLWSNWTGFNVSQTIKRRTIPKTRLLLSKLADVKQRQSCCSGFKWSIWKKNSKSEKNKIAHWFLSDINNDGLSCCC